MSEGLNVLFIEDDPPVRQATAQSLELAGFNVQAFGSAEEAIGKIDANFPGVVVSDLRLPGASGLDVLAHCQSFGTGIPVVLVTGHGDITMTRAAGPLVPNAGRFERILRERRRTTNPVSRVVMRLAGIEAKLNQYAAGAYFIDTIEATKGPRAVDVCWISPAHLPTIDEIRQPQRWLDRTGALVG